MNILSAFIAERINEARDIWTAIVDISCWIGRGIRRDMQGFYGDFRRLFQKKDPARFATKPPEFWRAKPKGGKQEVPKQEPLKGTKLADEKGNARAVALDFEMIEETDDRATHFEAEVLWGEVAHMAKGGESEISEREWYEMQHYSEKQRLSNLQVAKVAKRHWLLGKTAGQIADDSGLKLDSVKKYVACFVRAERHSPADGEGN